MCVRLKKRRPKYFPCGHVIKCEQEPAGQKKSSASPLSRPSPLGGFDGASIGAVSPVFLDCLLYENSFGLKWRRQEREGKQARESEGEILKHAFA